MVRGIEYNIIMVFIEVMYENNPLNYYCRQIE